MHHYIQCVQCVSSVESTMNCSKSAMCIENNMNDLKTFSSQYEIDSNLPPEKKTAESDRKL